MQYALEQYRQARDGLQPLHIVPGERVLQQAIKQRTLARVQWLRRGWRQPGQVHRRNTCRQAKTGTLFAVAGTAAGRVHGQHQRLCTRSLDPLHQFAGKAPVVLQIQLKPQRAAVWVAQHGCGHRLDSGAGLGAEHHAGTQRGSGIGAGQFAIGVRHALKGHGR